MAFVILTSRFKRWKCVLCNPSEPKKAHLKMHLNHSKKCTRVLEKVYSITTVQCNCITE